MATCSVKIHASKASLYQTVLFLWCSSGSGEEEEQLEQLMESVRFEEEEFLECFRCDLGFWDACYTTEINCSLGERCYTGRGKAGVLDKTISNRCMFRGSKGHQGKLINLNLYTEYHSLVSTADTLDVKTLGCVKAEECGLETTVELFSNKTIFVMTKHCCDTPFCNSAHKLPITTLLYLAVAVLNTWQLTEASAASQ